MKFRTLEASEIDLRVATINDKGLSLLLYKDARADMNILDEAVGSMNWQRSHLRDNANCIVSIWDEEKKQWISKEDTGAESFTEKEKGLASDSFKRACFNWGIGRELYTAPFIWISANDCDIKTGQNGKKITYDKFIVSKIAYDDKRNIVDLDIKNVKTNRLVFRLRQEARQGEPEPPKQEAAAEPPKTNNRKVAKAQVTKLMALAQSKGYSVEEVKTVSNKKFNKLDLYTLTVDEYQIMIKGFEGLEKREVK